MSSALPLALVLWPGFAMADCPDAVSATVRAIDALVAARLDEAEAALQQAEAGFTCGAPASREALARFWLAEAAVASVSGRAEDAADAWQAAARLAPELWDPRYGPALLERRDAALSAMGSGQGSLRVEPLPPRHQLVLDGEEVSKPAPASEGLHLVQVARREVVFGKLVLLGADEDMVVRSGLVEEENGRPTGRRVALVVGGGLGAAAGGGLLVVAARQDAPMEQAEARWRAGELARDQAADQAARAWRVQVAAGSAGYALTALGLASVGLGFAW